MRIVLIKNLKKISDSYNFSLQLNIHSVPKNVNNVITYMQNLKFYLEVIGLTETWINEANTKLHTIEDYVQRDLYRKERTGGGFSLMLKKI